MTSLFLGRMPSRLLFIGMGYNIEYDTQTLSKQDVECSYNIYAGSDYLFFIIKFGYF